MLTHLYNSGNIITRLNYLSLFFYRQLNFMNWRKRKLRLWMGKDNDSGIRKVNILLKSTFVNLIKKRLKENILFFQSMLRKEELLFLSM